MGGHLVFQSKTKIGENNFSNIFWASFQKLCDRSMWGCLKSSTLVPETEFWTLKWISLCPYTISPTLFPNFPTSKGQRSLLFILLEISLWFASKPVLWSSFWTKHQNGGKIIIPLSFPALFLASFPKPLCMEMWTFPLKFIYLDFLRAHIFKWIIMF